MSVELAASDLGPEEREVLLQHVREVLGDDKFRSQVDRWGEDIVLEAFLSSRPQAESAPSTGSTEVRPQDTHWAAQVLIWLVFWVLAFALDQLPGRWGDALSGFFAFPAIFFTLALGQILALGCGGLLAIAVIGGILGAIFGGLGGLLEQI